MYKIARYRRFTVARSGWRFMVGTHSMVCRWLHIPTT